MVVGEGAEHEPGGGHGQADQGEFAWGGEAMAPWQAPEECRADCGEDEHQCAYKQMALAVHPGEPGEDAAGFAEQFVEIQLHVEAEEQQGEADEAPGSGAVDGVRLLQAPGGEEGCDAGGGIKQGE